MWCNKVFSVVLSNAFAFGNSIEHSFNIKLSLNMCHLIQDVRTIAIASCSWLITVFKHKKIEINMNINCFTT